jgi:2-polyprenyl-6-methoxyphenol hydroxylase-like FAD-dependent oxidoreductase
LFDHYLRRVPSGSVIIAGGGVAGLASALLLSRAGWRVTLVERDALTAGAAEDSPSWERRGIPHFTQPHAFIPRGRQEMRESLPDVYACLLDVGAREVDLRRKLPGADPERPEDELLHYLAVRRPLIEWALRRAVLAERGIAVLQNARVTELDVQGGHFVAANVDGSWLAADLLVDAMGRRSPSRSWLSSAGVTFDEGKRSPCGVVYYSRYYRTNPGFELPDGPWILSPRGDLGYLGFSTFPGDNDTFAAVLAVPTGAKAWRALNEPSAFEKAVASITLLRLWVDPANVVPITDVLPMAGLYNTLEWHPTAATRVLPIGDAIAHTDPVLAHGLAFALIHARALLSVLEAHRNLDDAEAAYLHATAPALQERYALSTNLDAQRHRLWTGEAVDFAHRDGDYALFTQYAAAAAATRDPDVFRMFNRRIGLLDSTAVLDTDGALQSRIETLYDEMVAQPRAPLGPGREEMLALIGAAPG